MAAIIFHKGYEINSSPYTLAAGGYSVNGYVRFLQKNNLAVIKLSVPHAKNKYVTQKEADDVFVAYAKTQIDSGKI